MSGPNTRLVVTPGKRPRLAPAAEGPGATRAAILAAAEQRFAVEGLDAATMRQITTDAGVNLAAVNYHFGSKQDLALAVLDRLGSEVCQDRLVALDGLERSSAGPPPLEAMVRIFIGPYFGGDEGRRLLLVRLLQAHRLNPTPLTVRISTAYFDPFAARFTRMLADALPDLPRPRRVLALPLHGRRRAVDGGRHRSAQQVGPPVRRHRRRRRSRKAGGADCRVHHGCLDPVGPFRPA